jgi:hypothetical protein
MDEVAAGTQKAIKLAVAFGALASHAPGTMPKVKLPPLREEAAEEYVDKEDAVPKGLYEGVEQDVENAEQVPAEHVVVQPVLPCEAVMLLFEADHMASWNRGHELEPANEAVPYGHSFWYCELVPGGQ